MSEIMIDKNDLGKDYEGENIEVLLEQIKYNIDNQYKI
jgi:hypothetical protein